MLIDVLGEHTLSRVARGEHAPPRVAPEEHALPSARERQEFRKRNKPKVVKLCPDPPPVVSTGLGV